MAVSTVHHLTEVRQIFSVYLKKRGLRQTPERMSILEEIYGADDHFDADELYVRLKENDVAVSRATVYNTLELLIDCDLVERHQFGNKQAKYERSFSFWQHDHLICMDCNHIFEFCDPRIQSIQEMVSEVFDFQIEHHALHLYGRCRKDDCEYRRETSGETISDET